MDCNFKDNIWPKILEFVIRVARLTLDIFKTTRTEKSTVHDHESIAYVHWGIGRFSSFWQICRTGSRSIIYSPLFEELESPV